ncbi:copper-binding protein [Asanoa ishikariensis]|uniref:Copper transport protein n=1 Tax=Asanoa ishikariensis TaxID=137265 RepID=A0A1H3UA26_9ACTN|nr:copper resistance protein CopC [Asanoa ishikariensis]GIF64091.1 copper-binding protein [Asanoa ishikariensis]SDZ58675.1 copper transport protein [Asanoa ishikariensis]
MTNRLSALLLLALSAALVVGVSPPAYAHATVVSTDPAEGAVLATAPDQIRFTFDEAVRAVPDGMQVFDSQSKLVRATTTARGVELGVALPDGLRDGTTVITWRVVSEDGHPIGGALTFSVGVPTPHVAPPARIPDVPWPLTLARWLGYLGLLLTAGLVIFAAAFLPTGVGVDRRVAAVIRAAAAVTVVAWLAILPITATYLLGDGLSLLTQGSTWSALPLTEYAVTAVVISGSVLAVALLGRGRVAAMVAAVLAATAPALVGHTRAASPEALVIGADALHLLAGSVWLGGLVGLAVTLPRLAGRGAALTLARFSSAAAGVLAALVVTGALLGWRILGSWQGLVDTSYGRLLLAKIAVVLIAIAFAAWNRWSLLPRLTRATKRPSSRPVVRATAIEGAILVVALLITGFLVDTSPEGGAAPASASSVDTRTTKLGDIAVRATLAPLARGANTVTLRLSNAAGEPTDGIAPPVVRLSADQTTLGAVPLTQVSPGFYTAKVTLPVPGTWRMQVSLRVSEFTNPVSELEFTVAG